MRIAYDNKSHKRSRRAEIRSKESAKTAWMTPDESPRKPRRSVKPRK